MPQISSQAAVDKAARLAPDVKIGPFSYIGANVEIATGCTIENNVTIIGRTQLGANNHVFPMVSIGQSPGGDNGRCKCVIGEANRIREHTTIFGGERKPTRIGNDNLIMMGCYVGAGAELGDHGIFDNLTQIGAMSRIEDYVRTSAFTFMSPGVTVGAYTFTAAYVNVDEDAPPFAILQGCPFRIRGVNTHNLKRCAFGEDDIRELKRVFRDLFNGSGSEPDEKALRRLVGQENLNPHVEQFVQALRRRSDLHGRDA